MAETSKNLIQKLFVIVFGIIFIAVIALIGLTFIKPSQADGIQSKTIPYAISTVWMSLYDREIYLKSKKEIDFFNIYDTELPRWTEYYSSKDSVENKTVSIRSNSEMRYITFSRKYEQVNGFVIRLDSISEHATKLTVREKSIFMNNWANIYFRILRPDAIVKFEILKIENTLRYLESVKNKNKS